MQLPLLVFTALRIAIEYTADYNELPSVGLEGTVLQPSILTQRLFNESEVLTDFSLSPVPPALQTPLYDATLMAMAALGILVRAGRPGLSV